MSALSKCRVRSSSIGHNPASAGELTKDCCPCRNERYVKAVAERGLVMRFFDFLDIAHANNNIHNIRVCRVLVAAGAVSTQNLASLDVAGKV